MEMREWEKLSRPPATALKQIQAGRLKGKTDINPQWRYRAMTEVYGPCGVGWDYRIIRTWNEPAADGQIFAFAEVAVRIKHNGEWSEPIPGIGGSMLITQEKSGMHSSDEGYKMAVTDALSVALKMLGVASSIYEGNWDGTQYRDSPEEKAVVSDGQAGKIMEMLLETGSDVPKFLAFFKVSGPDKLTTTQYTQAITMLEAKRANP